MELPFKFKIGVSGCPNNCSESSIKDLGLVGMQKGWRVLAGGFVSGLKPRLADVIATGLNDDEALALTDKVIDWYRDMGKKKRLGRVIDDVRTGQVHGRLGLAGDGINILINPAGYNVEQLSPPIRQVGSGCSTFFCVETPHS